MDKITALMTTIPSREDVVQKVVDSIYDQVDELRIVFNDFESIPAWAEKKEKIVAITNTPDTYTSSAVWLLMDSTVSGFVFIVDDDAMYPSNYVSVMIQKLEEYDREVAITAHGIDITIPFNDYIKNRTVIHFKGTCYKDIIVDVIGVGYSVFHTDTIRPELKDFPDCFSRDPWFSVLLAKKRIPIVCIKKRNKWITPVKVQGVTVWDTVRNNSKLRTRKTYVIKELLLPLLRRWELN